MGTKVVAFLGGQRMTTRNHHFHVRVDLDKFLKTFLASHLRHDEIKDDESYARLFPCVDLQASLPFDAVITV